jgi:hypothetical protein
MPVTAPSTSTGATSGTTSTAVCRYRHSWSTSGGVCSVAIWLLVGNSKSAMGLRRMIPRRFAQRKNGWYTLRASCSRDVLRPALRIRPKIRSIAASSTSTTRHPPISRENHFLCTPL